MWNDNHKDVTCKLYFIWHHFSLPLPQHTHHLKQTSRDSIILKCVPVGLLSYPHLLSEALESPGPQTCPLLYTSSPCLEWPSLRSPLTGCSNTSDLACGCFCSLFYWSALLLWSSNTTVWHPFSTIFTLFSLWYKLYNKEGIVLFTRLFLEHDQIVTQ